MVKFKVLCFHDKCYFTCSRVVVLGLAPVSFGFTARSSEIKTVYKLNELTAIS